MAITKKHEAIREQKRALRAMASSIAAEMKDACQKVPRAVIDGDATLAVKWRTAAERALYTTNSIPDRASLADMSARIAEMQREKAFLQSPVA